MINHNYTKIAIRVGSCISILNLSNIDKSVQYNGFRMDNFRLACLSLVKGGIYGLFWPLSISGIAINTIGSTQNFSKHFIPGNGSTDLRAFYIKPRD